MAFLPSEPDADMKRALARVPAIGIPFSHRNEAVMRGDAPFSAGERELLAAYVSALNSCDYCQCEHAAVATAFGLPAGLLAQLLQDVETAEVSETFRAAVVYARKLTLCPTRLGPADVEALFAAGHDERALYLSLSRLNHWLPWGQTDSEVMQGTTEFHHEIADAVLPQPDAVFHDATALDAAIDMLDPEPAVMQRLIGALLLPCQPLIPWLLGRHQDLHLWERERQKAQLLQQPASRGQGIRRRVGNRLVMDAASTRVTEKEDDEQRID
jgi:uncharacterized peroxidase-related enzyme